MSYSFLAIFLILSTAFGLGVDNYTTTCECGRRNGPNSKTRKSSIYGGTDALDGEWPYPVLLKIAIKDGNGFCGGTIITKRHVLTAAHCVFGFNKKQITIVYNSKKKQGKERLTYPKKIYTHEKYHAPPKVENDISLIFTTTEFPFDQRVGPVCYGMKRVPDGGSVIALGWGDSDKSDSIVQKLKKSIPKRKLKEVKLVTKNIDECSTYLTDSNWNLNNFICVEMTDKSVCAGDSGGPLLSYDSQLQRYFLVGITSVGLVKSHTCPPDSTRFTDVSLYKNWVSDKIKIDTHLHLCTLQ